MEYVFFVVILGDLAQKNWRKTTFFGHFGWFWPHNLFTEYVIFCYLGDFGQQKKMTEDTFFVHFGWVGCNKNIDGRQHCLVILDDFGPEFFLNIFWSFWVILAQQQITEDNLFLIILGDFGPKKKNSWNTTFVGHFGWFWPKQNDGRQFFLVILGDFGPKKMTRDKQFCSFLVILVNNKKWRKTTFVGHFGWFWPSPPKKMMEDDIFW